MKIRRDVRSSDPPGRSAAGPSRPDSPYRQGPPRPPHDRGSGPTPSADLSPLIRRLEAEFGKAQPEGKSLRWRLPDAIQPGRTVTVVATPIGSEGWMDVTVTFEAHHGTSCYGSTAIRPGASLDRFVQIIRQSVATHAGPYPRPDPASEEEAS